MDSTTRDQQDDSSTSSQNLWSAFIQSRLARIWVAASRDQSGRMADACQAVDEELAAMHLVMCSLRTHRNAMMPISSLPSEILARIFWLYGAQEIQEWTRSHLKWMIVTHVCRQWRDVALQDPSLWREPDLTLGIRWSRLMLSRANTMPLTIQCSLSHSSAESDLIMSHISHIHHLSLHGAAGDLRSTLQSSPSPASIMESLKLSAWIDNQDFVLLDELRDKFPQLRRIELASIPIHWSSPILCGLTHLKLAFQSWFQNGVGLEHAGGDNIADIISLYNHFFLALERMPALEVLILENALPSRPQHLLRGHINVVLPHLRKLSLDDMTTRCVDIVTQLSFPQSCSLTLNGTVDISMQDFADVLPVLSDHTRDVGQPNSSHVLAVLIESIQSSHTIQLNIWQNRALVNGPPNLQLRVPLPGDPIMRDLFDALPLDNLHFLSVEHVYNSRFAWTPRRWIERFGRCRAVEHVQISRMALPFIVALGLPVSRPHTLLEQDAEEESASERPFLENLRTLTLKNVDLDAQFRNKPKTMCESIVQRLTIRKQIQAPLPTIRMLPDCNASPKSREELEKIAHVVWLSKADEVAVEDGNGSYFSDD